MVLEMDGSGSQFAWSAGGLANLRGAYLAKATSGFVGGLGLQKKGGIHHQDGKRGGFYHEIVDVSSQNWEFKGI